MNINAHIVGLKYQKVLIAEDQLLENVQEKRVISHIPGELIKNFDYERNLQNKMIVIISIILALFYCILPLWMKVIVTIINTVVPDPIPFLDEILMYGGILTHMATLGRILEFKEEHPYIFKSIVILSSLTILVVIVGIML